MRKIFYGWQVYRVNPGAGGDALELEGGFFLDKAIAPGSFPNASGGGSVITSLNQAVSQCLSYVRSFQRRGIDMRGEVSYQIFGTDVANAKRPMVEADLGVGQPVTIARLDVPELGVYRKVSAANTPQDDALLGDAGYDEGGNQDVP